MNKKKSTGLIIAGVSLLIVSIFCVLTVVGIFRWAKNEGSQSNIFSNDIMKATADETLTINSEDINELEFILGFSDIEITEGEGSEIILNLVKTGWGASLEEAEKAADSLSLEQKKRGGKITFSIDNDLMTGFTIGLNRTDAIDVKLTIPKDLKIKLNINSGEIIVSDLEADLDIKSDFGNVTVEHFIGGLAIDSSNGDINLTENSVSGDFVVTSDFGDINATKLSAADITIHNRNGKTILEDIAASGDCQLNTDFTDIEVNKITCQNLTAETKNGKIEFTQGDISGLFKLTTDFGDLIVKSLVAESYSFSTRNGKVFADSLQGDVKLDSDFGDIEFYGDGKVVLSVENRNGDFFYQGTLAPNADHVISSSFGSIKVLIPSESAFDILMKSEFGEIDTDFMLTLTGDIRTNELEGMINGGGSLLKMDSRNGDIVLKVLEE
ncbi:MAG: DUF4097 family beta strand repeat protein [Anaerolineaceae bacterium]|nr:DUF4097 family beta strand repeat protein [Anaerolineaceae bacterium]